MELNRLRELAGMQRLDEAQILAENFQGKQADFMQVAKSAGILDLIQHHLHSPAIKIVLFKSEPGNVISMQTTTKDGVIHINAIGVFKNGKINFQQVTTKPKENPEPPSDRENGLLNKLNNQEGYKDRRQLEADRAEYGKLQFDRTMDRIHLSSEQQNAVQEFVSAHLA